MKHYSTIIIGGGAAGICAAISTARRGQTVVVCEKTDRIGKKILASGDGRCNLLNEDLSETHYNTASRELVKSVFNQFDKSAILDFFRNLGLEVYVREGRIFPITNQAASVLKVLEMELARLSVPIEFNFDCCDITFSGSELTVASRSGKTIKGDKVIVTGGGKTYPSFGSDGSTFELAVRLGHTLVQPVPSVVPLVVKDALCNKLLGQRIFAAARSIINGNPGQTITGELLFTKYGLSGTCVLDVSEDISIALHRQGKTDVAIAVDMLPFIDSKQLKSELAARRQKGLLSGDMLTGLLPNKMSAAMAYLFTGNDLDTAVSLLKDRHFKVTATRGWNDAEFTSGGVSTQEIVPGTLESSLHRGLYFAGEVIDVNGQRGGYNLGWAWASGFVTGLLQGEISQS